MKNLLPYLFGVVVKFRYDKRLHWFKLLKEMGDPIFPVPVSVHDHRCPQCRSLFQTADADACFPIEGSQQLQKKLIASKTTGDKYIVRARIALCQPERTDLYTHQVQHQLMIGFFVGIIQGDGIIVIFDGFSKLVEQHVKISS